MKYNTINLTFQEKQEVYGGKNNYTSNNNSFPPEYIERLAQLEQRVDKEINSCSPWFYITTQIIGGVCLISMTVAYIYSLFSAQPKFDTPLNRIEMNL